FHVGLRKSGPEVQGGAMRLAVPGSVHAKTRPLGVLNRFIIQIKSGCQDNLFLFSLRENPWKRLLRIRLSLWAEATLHLRSQTASYSSSFYLLPPAAAPRPEGSAILWY